MFMASDQKNPVVKHNHLFNAAEKKNSHVITDLFLRN
jgi:hypothetical protein